MEPKFSNQKLTVYEFFQIRYKRDNRYYLSCTVFERDNILIDIISSFFFRVLTYFYLAWRNFYLLVVPINLCYDYSIGTIPLITTILEIRNLSSFFFLILNIGGAIMFYFCLFKKVCLELCWCSFYYIFEWRGVSEKQRSSRF